MDQACTLSPILDMQFPETMTDINTNGVLPPLCPFSSTSDVGCPTPPLTTSPIIIQEAKKLTIPHLDPEKMSWSSFAMKLHASLIECDMAYLLKETHTTPSNAHHTKKLMLELFKNFKGVLSVSLLA